MATKTKLFCPKLLNRLRLLAKNINSSSASSSSSSVSPLLLTDNLHPKIEKPPTVAQDTANPTSILDLADHQKLFASLPTSKLLRASLNLQLASMEPLVDFGTWVMGSKLMETQVPRDLVLATVRHTFYEHFCCGEDIKEAGKSVRKLSEAGLRGMLDFAIEFTGDNDACDRNLERFLEAVDSAMSLPPSSVSFVVVKVTAICPLNLLERVSDLLRWQQKDPSFNLPWKNSTFPIFADSSPLHHTLKAPEPLTSHEEQDLQFGQQRLWKICQRCVEANVPLAIDAEHTSVQPAIDYLTYSSAISYNKDDNPIVYGTIQTYLKDAKDRLLLVTKAADKMGVPMGIKLVRGAYMSSERKLASSLGYESPIHNTIQQTHACFNDCASFMLERIANGPDGVVLATHNVESGRLAAKKARDLEMQKRKRKLEFAQLYGMAESLSFALRSAGFQVSKYMPYGPVGVVIPYLLRRAEENRGLLSTSRLDRELMRKELNRRLKAAIF